MYFDSVIIHLINKNSRKSLHDLEIIFMSSPIASCYPCKELINESENKFTPRIATNGCH